jgi:D-aminopeptidase
MTTAVALVLLAMLLPVTASPQGSPERVRARALRVSPGVLPPGPSNSITDVPGVRVGQTTVIAGDSIHTGVTAILPHAGNLFKDRVPAAIVVGNGFGKLLGVTQVNELGELETPVLLTCTLCVWRAADAMIEYLLEQPGMDEVRSINPVVGETNDGYLLNAIRRRPISPEAVRQALTGATSVVQEGSVGAGAGTVAFGWKGGIGTSSRVTRGTDSPYTVGVLVQSNFGGDLHILGVPVGRELKRLGVKRRDEQGAKGSIMIVAATDAPLSDRNLRRLGTRALIGVGRTGSAMDNGSGDYVIAFSTSPRVRRRADEVQRTTLELANDVMSSLFQATVEATEEAIYNSLFMATTVASQRGTVEALPIDEVMKILRSHRALNRAGPLPLSR